MIRPRVDIFEQHHVKLKEEARSTYRNRNVIKTRPDILVFLHTAA